MQNLALPELPGELNWHNKPLSAHVDNHGTLHITAGPETDWFIDPAGGTDNHSAPVGLFTPCDEHFLFSSRVTVDFASSFDAGVLFIYLQHNLWAKLCFEYSPQKEPMIVSVVTRGTSDDANAVVIPGNTIYLRVSRDGDTFAFHYAEDGITWHLARYFTLGPLKDLQIGFSAQSPTGEACTASFAEITYQQEKLKDIRNGS